MPATAARGAAQERTAVWRRVALTAQQWTAAIDRLGEKEGGERQALHGTLKVEQLAEFCGCRQHDQYQPFFVTIEEHFPSSEDREGKREVHLGTRRKNWGQVHLGRAFFLAGSNKKMDFDHPDPHVMIVLFLATAFMCYVNCLLCIEWRKLRRPSAPPAEIVVASIEPPSPKITVTVEQDDGLPTYKEVCSV